MRHHSPAGAFARVPGRCLRWSPTPPGPRWPPAKLEVLHLFRWYTHIHTFAQALLHTDAFTHKHFHTQRLLHTDAFTHRGFYTQKLLHTDTFTHRHFYTKRLLHTDAFTHRHFYSHAFTQTLLHTDAFTHRGFYTQKLLHTDTFTHRHFYTKRLLHTDAFTHRHFYTHALHTDAFNSVHNASYLSVHVWAQERGKEVNYACRCRVAQSTAKHLFSDFQTENTTHEFDMAKNHCRRDLQTESWTHQQKTSLTKLGNKKLSSSATPSCIISQCLVSSCIILDFQTENTIREFDTWDGHHCRTYQPKFGLKKNGTVIRREDTCYSILIYNFPHKLAKKARYHDAVNYMHHTVLEGNIHKGTTNPTAW